MTLSEELAWRGFVNQTTYKDITTLDGDPIRFYFGVDPSADSMTIGNLAAAMMTKCFIKHGHQAFLLVGGATGLIGDPDGKSEERSLKSIEDVARNKQAIAGQYAKLYGEHQFTLVDNYDWFEGMHYLDFLRDIGKNVPLRQMLGREFVQSRLGEQGSGISYAEFSYVLIQAYDFLHLFEEYQVSLQVCGSDQWGNCIAGVDLIRRKTGQETNVYSVPLIINKATGQKFGKSEEGAIWLDPAKTTPTQFYQFWINSDDAGAVEYLKIFTELDKDTIEQLAREQQENPSGRAAQRALARAVTTLVHGETEMQLAESVTDYIIGKLPIGDAGDALDGIRNEIAHIQTSRTGSLVDALVDSGLAVSKSDARRLLSGNAVSINGQKVSRESFEDNDFQNGRLLLRKGKAFKDTALIEVNEQNTDIL
jgi:tyrosyl-tRNA synthetase